MEESEEESKRLLIELGLFSLDSESSLEKRISELNMRQLDRLKLMFGRVDKVRNIFSEKTRVGIRKNELSAFAEAVQRLNGLLK